MQGVCLPKCTFKLDGSKPVGCPGKDTCLTFTVDLDSTTGAVTGYGFCQGSCTQDSDCAQAGTGFVCQKDIGFCTNKPVARGGDGGPGSIGTQCTKAQAEPTTGVGLCNCQFNSQSNNGYCTQSCVVGDQTYPCPQGYVCDNGSAPVIDFGDAGKFPQTMQNVDTPGLCIAKCTVPDAGTLEDGAAQCPPFGQCVNLTVPGPDCFP
jgi:hypothetical protein